MRKEKGIFFDFFNNEEKVSGWMYETRYDCNFGLGKPLEYECGKSNPCTWSV